MYSLSARNGSPLRHDLPASGLRYARHMYRLFYALGALVSAAAGLDLMLCLLSLASTPSTRSSGEAVAGVLGRSFVGFGIAAGVFGLLAGLSLLAMGKGFQRLAERGETA